MKIWKKLETNKDGHILPTGYRNGNLALNMFNIGNEEWQEQIMARTELHHIEIIRQSMKRIARNTKGI